MTQHKVDAVLIDEETLDLHELASACAVPPTWVVERVEGMAPALGPHQQDQRLGDRAVLQPAEHVDVHGLGRRGHPLDAIDLERR